MKDGDNSLPTFSGFPFTGSSFPFNIFRNPAQILFQGQNPIVLPQPPPQVIQAPSPQIIQTPSGPIVIRSPSPQVIQQPGQPIVLPNPRCPRNFICPANQFFDENQCRCVCATQQTCFAGQRFDNSQCQCVCAVVATCSRSFQTFNPVTCRCEPQACPGRCSRCETQDPNTCACQPIQGFCPFGQVLNPSSCQCSCGFVQCNGRSQRLNPQTCQCQCVSFTATIVETVPGTPGPPIAVPGEIISRTGTRTGTGTTRRRTGKKRRNVEEENKFDDAAIEGPEVDEVLQREKRRRTRTRTRTSTRIVVSQPPTFIPGPPGAPGMIRRTVDVGVCPPGTRPNEFTCTCF